MAPGEYRRCGGWGASVHSITGNHQQEDGVEGCHGDIHLCRRPGSDWWRMANRSYMIHWRSGTGGLSERG